MSRDQVNVSRVLRASPLVHALLAGAVLLAGYVDLWVGGMNVGAILLVLGYVVCVPMAIMQVGADARRASRVVARREKPRPR